MPHRNEELVVTVLYELKSKIQGTERISVTHIINQLKDIIIEEYDGRLHVAEYEELWITRIRSIALIYQYDLATKAPSWGRVEPLLILKALENLQNIRIQNKSEFLRACSSKKNKYINS